MRIARFKKCIFNRLICHCDMPHLTANSAFLFAVNMDLHFRILISFFQSMDFSLLIHISDNILHHCRAYQFRTAKGQSKNRPDMILIL